MAVVCCGCRNFDNLIFNLTRKEGSMDRRLINSYLLVKSLERAASGWFFSTYVLFLLANGLTAAQATQVNMAYMLGNFVFNLPTGALGDVLGNVPVYLSGAVILGTGFFAYGLGHSFAFFFACEGASAVGGALMSNALEALLTNEIGVDRAKNVKAQAGIYGAIASMPTALAGAFVGATVGLEYPWFLASVTMLACFIVGAVVLKEHHTVRHTRLASVVQVFPKFGASIKGGTVLIFSKKPLIYSAMILMALAVATQAINMFWAPIFKEEAGATWWMGALWVAIAAFSIVGAQLSKRLKANLVTIGCILLAIGIPLIMTNIFPHVIWVTCSLFLAHEIGRGMWLPVVDAYANTYIANDVRNTANSTLESFEVLARWAGLWAAGTLTQKAPQWLVDVLTMVLDPKTVTELTSGFSLLTVWELCGLVVFAAGLIAIWLGVRVKVFALVLTAQYQVKSYVKKLKEA